MNAVTAKALGALLSSALLAGCAAGSRAGSAAQAPADASDTAPPSLPGPEARLGDPELVETSGLTASLSGPGRYWALNDGGNPARLHALDSTGGALASIPVQARNRDWEALESGVFNGVATLYIGETGDNGRQHAESALLLVTEPELATAPAAPVERDPLDVRRLPFVYEGGPRDVEAMSLDDGVLWLLDKPPLAEDGSRNRSGLYRLDLTGLPDGSSAATSETAPLVARRAGDFLAPAEGFIARLAAGVSGVDLGAPTGLELDPQRGHAWVLTYLDVLRYDRVGQESWEVTLSRPPARQITHGLAQAEALALDASGAVVITSEGDSAPLVAIELDE